MLDLYATVWALAGADSNKDSILRQPNPSLAKMKLSTTSLAEVILLFVYHLFEQSSSDEELFEEEEEKLKSDDHEVTSVAESDITTASEVSVPEEKMELCPKTDFDSDGTTLSDVSEQGDDNNFSQWTDSMDALVASFDVPAESLSTAGVDESCKTETLSALDFPATTPVQRRARILSVGNTTSPSAVKRHLEANFDAVEEPPNNRPRQIRDETVADAQSKLSPLRKTLSSTLSLRTS